MYHIHSEGIFKKDSKPPQDTTSFQYVRRVSRIRLDFEAMTEDGRDVFVKFGNGHQGAETHQAATASGLSPALPSYQMRRGDDSRRRCGQVSFLV
jgi:hypothetical protein